MKNYFDIFETKVTISELEEGKNKDILATLEFPFGVSGKINLNKRYYPDQVWKDSISGLDKKIQTGFVPGTAGHPMGGAGTPLKDVSHILTKVWVDENKKGWARATVLNTEAGRTTMTVLKSGAKIGASLRGYGEVDNRGAVKRGLEIKTVDLVIDPSFAQDATITPANIIESTILDEAFFSLRDSLQTEIVKKFGKDYWLVDFSDTEAVFRKEGTEGYKKISYNAKGDDLELTGEAVSVQRKVQYEGSGELSQDELRLAGTHIKARPIEGKAGQRTKEGAFAFTEAIMSGYKGNFEKWKKEFGGEEA